MTASPNRRTSVPWWLTVLWVAFAAAGVVNLFTNIPSLGYVQLALLVSIAVTFVLRAGRS